MTANLIVLLTDFGDKDPYVGIMKGVISQIGPDLRLIDLSHQIPPGDIQEGAFHLWQAIEFFPPGTVFLAVVDPGVGTIRKGLFLKYGNQVLIGPDNGLFTYLTYKTDTTAWELTNPEYQLPNPSHTFHGRDIFAPAAANAALGTAGNLFGKAVHSLINLPRPLCQLDNNQLKGEVVSIDQFGNLITSLGQFEDKGNFLRFNSWIETLSRDIPKSSTIVLDQTPSSLPLVSTFTDIPHASCAGLIGSSGLLEIAAHQSSAANLLGLSRGDKITLSCN